MIKNEVFLDIKKYIEERIYSFDEILLSESEFAIPESLSLNRITENIEEYIDENKKMSFKDLLFDRINELKLSDAETYKKAGLDRRLFSKIRSKVNYHPSKNTVIALVLALELDINRAKIFLSTAGYSFADSEKFDLIIQYCIEHKMYNYMDVNEVLDHFQLNLLVV